MTPLQWVLIGMFGLCILFFGMASVGSSDDKDRGLVAAILTVTFAVLIVAVRL